MNLFVDTSVWSLAWRRDAPSDLAEVALLARALDDGELIFTTGIVLQELLQGFQGPRAKQRIIARFGALPYLVPDRVDHVEAANIQTGCRKKGIAIGTIDALLAQLCIRYELRLLTTDADFTRIASVFPLSIVKRE